MRVIHKYILEIIDPIQVLSGLDFRSRVVHVGEQSGRLAMWVEKEADTNSDDSLNFIVKGTGHPIEDDHYHHSWHVGTVQMESGLVWHLFHIRDIEPYRDTPTEEIER